MFTFFKRSSSKHKCEDSRSASGTPPPCSQRLPSPSLLTAAAGGGSGERKAASKNKRVRFKFVSDRDEVESRQKRDEKPVSASRSNQLHGTSVGSASAANDQHSHPFYSVEEPLSPIDDRHTLWSPEGTHDQHGNQLVGVIETDPEGEVRRKPRSALNQLLDKMGGKKNRFRGNAGGGHSKKPKHHTEQMALHQQQQPHEKRLHEDDSLQNVDENGYYFNPNGHNDKHRDYTVRCGGGVDPQSEKLASEKGETFIGDYDENAEDADTDCGYGVNSGVGAHVEKITEVGTGKATSEFDFNARGAHQNENRPVEILHKINPETTTTTTKNKSAVFFDDEEDGEKNSLWLSQSTQREQHESFERPQFRLFVNEQPTIAEELSPPPHSLRSIVEEEVDGQTQEGENPSADFVRDLVLNRYKKKRDRPINRRVEANDIPTVIRFDEQTVPLVIEKSDDDDEDTLRMGQPNSKASSPHPLEKSSSDGSIHPTVIITEEEVFYEANDGESVLGVISGQDVEEPQQQQLTQDDGILRVHSPLTIGNAFKTIHVSTEDLQDELEREESEAEDSGNYNQNTCYQNTLRNKSGVTVTEIVDDEEENDGSTYNGEEEEDSGCEEILGSVSPQQRPSPIPLVVDDRRGTGDSGNMMDGEVEEEEEDISDDHFRESMMARKRKVKMESSAGVVTSSSLPDVVESIGLPNVVNVMNVASVKFNHQQSDNHQGVNGKMSDQQNGSHGVLHVDGNSHRSSVVRNIPITILEEASEEEGEEEVAEVAMEVDSKVNQGPKNKEYQWTNGITTINDAQQEQLKIEGFGCDKRDLVNQDALQSKGRAAELQSKLDELERALNVKEWTIDRLEAELASATKEGEGVRRKLRQQEEDMAKCRHTYQDSQDDLNIRFQDLEDRYNQTTEKLASIQAFTSHLQVQLAEAQSDADSSRAEKEQLIRARTEEEKIIQDSLDQAIEERHQVEAKWQREFEQLRNFNQDREEHLMQDCEWKMRMMQRQCKEKLDSAEELQRELADITRLQEDKIESLSTLEAEVKGLRGLTGEQRENLAHIMRQLEEAKEELNEANERCEEEIQSAQKVKTQCENELLCKERYAQIKIEEAKMQISVQWERKLMEEMLRLKCELEAVHAEDRKEALDKLKQETTVEINDLVKAHKELEKALNEEIKRLKDILLVKREELLDAQKYSDKQVVDTRIYVERSDRQNQMILDREIRNREELIEQMEKDREREREEMEEQFRDRLQSVKDEFARELVESTQEVEAKYKRIIETQIERFVADKEEQLQTAETRHRHKIQTMEEEMRALEVQFQREKSDYERNHNIERTSMAKREMQNSQEIDTLHRKCRCLTKLFEEMRMRYERRESRQEDQREIGELKERCESQERDLARLTETLRQLQIIQEHHPTPPGQDATMPEEQRPTKGRHLVSPGHNCDVIYEEEEQESEEQEDTSIDETEEESISNSCKLAMIVQP